MRELGREKEKKVNSFIYSPSHGILLSPEAYIWQLSYFFPFQ